MLARSLTAILVAATAVSAWPIFFHPTTACHTPPDFVLHKPPFPGECYIFHDRVESYAGRTADGVQKILLYNDADLCFADTHRIYYNYTINNSSDKCVSFKKHHTPTAYVFIEEFLPIPHPPGNISNTCDKLIVQT